MLEGDEPKKFLFLGDSDGGGAASRLAVADIPYIKKRLESGAPNWRTIIDILESGQVLGVLVKLNTRSMERMVSPTYSEVREAMFAGIGSNPHIVFVHESFFWDAHSGQPEDDDPPEDPDHDDWFGDDYFKPLSPHVTRLVNELLDRHQIHVVPYERNVEINVLAGEFVDQQQRNVLFRFYVPKGRIFARETETILGLFRDYLTAAVNVEVRQTSHTTATGTIYEFSGGDAVTTEQVSNQIASFSEVMDLCVRDPGLAERRLVELGADKGQAREVIDRYTKQLRRLAVDIRHERQTVTLRIRQRLESELVEILPASEIEALQSVIDMIIPDGQSVIHSLGMGATPSMPSGSSLTVNIRPQFFNQVQGIIAQEVSGTINLSLGAVQMMELVERSGGDLSQSLRSAIYELEDPSTSTEHQLSAKARLKAFAFNVMRKGGEKLLDAGGEALAAYIRGTLGI
jgi:hypothetical protein